MGEAAEHVLDGLLCEECRVLIDGQAPGFLRKCDACVGERDGLFRGPKGREHFLKQMNAETMTEAIFKWLTP